MIILIGGEKGGTGKTTLAVNLAVLNAAAGKDVLLVDTDPQGSANFWSEIRSESSIEPSIQCVQKSGKALAKQLVDLHKRYENIIVDAGGRDSVELRAAMAVADRAFIPVQASQFDMWTVTRMSEVVEQVSAINPDLDAWLIINRAPTNPSVNEAEEAAEYVADFDNLKLCPVVMRERITYRKAAPDGLAITELTKRDQKAISELNDLYSEVFE